MIGTGLSLLQTAANPYVTILGPMESAAKRISIMGVCNKVAGVLAPIVLGAVVLHDADQLEAKLEVLQGLERSVTLDELAGRVVKPYALMAVALVGLAILVRFSALPELEAEGAQPSKELQGGGAVLRHPQLVLGVVALFLYVGAEVIAGDTIGRFAQTQGMPLSEAKHLTSYTLAAMVIGYFLGIIAIPRHRSGTCSCLVGGGRCAVHGCGLAARRRSLGDGDRAARTGQRPDVAGHLAPGHRRSRILTKVGSALLIMAIAGGAVMPLVYGALADMDAVGNQQAYWILVPCYLFIGWYALQGHRRRAQA